MYEVNYVMYLANGKRVNGKFQENSYLMWVKNR